MPPLHLAMLGVALNISIATTTPLRAFSDLIP